MQPQVLTQQRPRSSDGGAVARSVGVLLLLPAVVLTVITLVIPTVRTIGTSMTSESLFRGAGSEPVGFDNYSRVFEDPRFWPSVGFALSLALLPILVTLVVTPLVAAAVDWAGGWARWTARVALSAAIVVFSPVALVLAWQRGLADEPALLADPDLTGGTLRTTVLMMAFGVVCAAGVLIFLPAFRGRRKLWPTLFTIAGLALLALLAAGLQQFTVPYVLSGFGPGNETLTPVGFLFRSAFQADRLGEAAAVSTVLLVLLALLGVAAVLVVVLTRLRVSVGPRRSDRRAVNPGAIVVALLALVAVGVVAVLTMGPWFDALDGPPPEGLPGAGDRTWTWAVLGALVSVGVAYLAALGVSGLRPLGRHSEWLLMFFAPWLFVGVAPLSVEFYKALRDAGEVDVESSLLPPILVAVLPLLIMAVLCRGQAERWQQRVSSGAPAAGAFFRTVVLPTLPLAGFLFVVVALVHGQDLFWPMLVAATPENATVPLTLVITQGSMRQGDFSVASATPMAVVLVAFVALAVVQVLHLDRLTATVGRPDDPTEPFRSPVYTGPVAPPASGH
jgi:ABC-type sugar transport system permease subunit